MKKNKAISLNQRFPTFYTGGPVIFYKKIHGPVRKIYNKAKIDTVYIDPLRLCYPLELRAH